jgi:hypothetical protein
MINEGGTSKFVEVFERGRNESMGPLYTVIVVKQPGVERCGRQSTGFRPGNNFSHFLALESINIKYLSKLISSIEIEIVVEREFAC